MAQVKQMGTAASDAVAITPSDATNFTEGPTQGVYIGGDGNMVAIMAGSGSAITFTEVKAGTVLPISITRVNSTSTTATAMVALY